MAGCERWRRRIPSARFPAMGTARNGNFLFALFGMNKKTVGRLANIAFLTGDYGESEKG
jgi:hypothetical protein